VKLMVEEELDLVLVELVLLVLVLVLVLVRVLVEVQEKEKEENFQPVEHRSLVDPVVVLVVDAATPFLQQ
jgi:hypothetical protein